MAPKTEKILVVEDDAQIRNFICLALRRDGYSALKTADTAQQAMSLLVSEPFALMLLDLGLPDFDGMEVIKKVREWSEMPIIVVSARDLEQEKVTALDCGADDYLTKPFSAGEMLARIRVALRHSSRSGNAKALPSISVGNLTMNFEKRLVYLNGGEIHLTPLEYDLLALFFKNAGKVLTTSFIIRKIYGVRYGTDTQALRALMAGLRRKIEPNPAKPRYILTEIGVGYRLVDE